MEQHILGRVHYFDIGLKSGWADTLPVALLTPLSIIVASGGEGPLGAWGHGGEVSIALLVLAFAMTCYYSGKISQSITGCVETAQARRAFRHLYTGFATGNFIKMAALFMLFHVAAMQLTAGKIVAGMQWIRTIAAVHSQDVLWGELTTLALAYRQALIPAAFVVVMMTLIVVSVPGLTLGALKLKHAMSSRG